MLAAVFTAWEQPVVRLKVFEFAPIIDRFTGAYCDFELDRIAGLALNDFCPAPDVTAHSQIRNSRT